MLSLQILAAATCPTGQTAAPRCVMEIFTFIQMGAKPEDIELDAIGGDGTTVESIIDNFKNFKGEEAQCFMPADRERLLAVIESAFGDFRFFNQIVRREFAAANERLEQKSEKNLLSAERLPAVTV